MALIKPSLLSLFNFLVILLLLPVHKSSSQVKSYDEVLYRTVVKTAGSDITLAKKLADSLYRSSEQPLHKVKSLMLLSELDLTTGHKKEGIGYAFEAEQIASDNKLYEWQARIYGFIATHYRTIGLKKQSKLYLKNGLEAIGNVNDIHIVNQYKAMVYQELALYDIEDKNYKNAIATLKKAEPYFKFIRNKELQQYQLATNFGQLGRAYLNIKDTKTAIVNFKKALLLLSQIKQESAVLKGFMHEGIGRALLEEQAIKQAKPYLDKALSIALSSSDLSLNEEVYCDLAIYYMETGSLVQYNKYSNLFQAARENSVKVNKESAEIVVNRLEERQKKIEFQHTLLFAGLGLTSLFLIIALIVARAKKKKQYVKFQEIIQNISQHVPPFGANEITGVLAPVEVTVAEISLGEKEMMPREVEEAILNKLSVFEQGDAFANTSINLASLSVMLETNSKYLSHVINKHKGKDFSNYINDLRIYYILRKLESSPEYLNYKISYLAEKSGFSSHSKFTAKFTGVTGMSPSTFMSLLRKENKIPTV